MMSARRTAQLGLGAACLTLVASVTVLIAGSVDGPDDHAATPSASASTTHVAPLASSQLESFQTDRLATAK